MFSFSRSKQHNIIGLDISSSAVKLLELSHCDGKLQVESYGVSALPHLAVVRQKIQEPEQVGDAIRQIIERINPASRQAVAAVSGAAVITRTLVMDANLPPAELEAQVLVDAESLMPLPSYELALDFSPLGPSACGQHKQDVLLVACRQETVDLLQATLENGGLAASAIEVENYALERALAWLIPALKPSAPASLIGVVDIGANAINLSMLRDRQLIYSRRHCCAAATPAKDNTSQLGLSGPLHQARLQQISRALQRFDSSGAYSRPDLILLTGWCCMPETGSSKRSISDLAEAIQAHLAIPTQVANPFRFISLSNRINPQALYNDAPALLLAFGLAIRDLGLEGLKLEDLALTEGLSDATD